MLKTRVKAGGITNLTDARYFAAWEVEWLGFCLDPNAQPHLSPQEMMAIREWVEGVRVVGEFNMQSAAELEASIQLLQLDDLFVGPLASTETLKELQPDIPVIKELFYDPSDPVGTIQQQFEAFTPYVSLFQLSLDKQGVEWKDLNKETVLNLRLLYDWASQFPLLLGIQVPPDQLPQLLTALPLQGICVQGGEEEQVGYKSFDELDAFFEAIEEEEA